MNEGTNKIVRGGDRNKPENIDGMKILDIGEVVSVADPNDLGRIKVRIKGPRNKGGDDGVLDKDLPWCFPMMTKLFSVQPKVKEAVFVFVFGKNKEHADRMYFGPIISQSNLLNNDPYYMTALRGFTFSSQNPNIAISTIPQLKGVFPNPEDVSVQGRYNTDITQKHNQIIIRAGKFNTSTPDSNNPYPFTFNNKTQGYIQIKNDVQIELETNNGSNNQEKGTITNIVSNKINLLTHKDGSPRFNLTNQNDLISDEEMLKILDEAHQLAFGDIQLEYLILLKNAFLSHVHNGSGNVPSGQALLDFKTKAEDLEKRMLSKNIRIN
jgi:hypothetical protein